MSSFSLIGEMCAVLSAICWAVATILFTTPSRQLRPEAVNLFKTTLAAALLLLTVVVFHGQSGLRPTDRTEAAYLVVSGVLGISIADTLFFWCLRKLGAWRSLVLTCLIPPFTVLLSALILHDPVAKADGFGIGVILGGVLLVAVSGGKKGEDGLSFTPDGVGVGAAMSALVALAIVLAKLGMVETGAVEASTIRIVAAVPGILVIEAARGKLGTTIRSALTPPHPGKLIAGSVTGTYAAYLLFIAGIKYAHPGVAMALATTSPAFVIPLSAIFLRERVSLLGVAGTALALSGIVILFVL